MRSLLVLLWVITFAACATNVVNSGREASSFVDDGGVYDGAIVDAGVVVDAPPDAPIATISMTTGWDRTVVTAGAFPGVFRGADGVAIDSAGCVVTPWEEGGIVTRACEIMANVWTTKMVTTGVSGPEDAKTGDFDGDGNIDIAVTADTGKRVYVTFLDASGNPNSTIVLTASINHGNAMQAAIADYDHDGWLDIAFGTRVGSATNPAVVAIMKNPGCLSQMSCAARNGSAWTYNFISIAGWVMSLEPADFDGDGFVDLVVSDRGYYQTTATGSTRLWDLSGPRWLKNPGAGGGVWVNKRIGPGAGSCPANNYLCLTDSHGVPVTPGDELFLRVISPSEIWDCQSSLTKAPSRIRHLTTTDGWATYTAEILPPASDAAHCQDVLITDVNGDGLVDVVVSGEIDDRLPTQNILPGTVSIVYWMLAPTWARGEISNKSGCKADNIQQLPGSPFRVITSEQVGDDCVAGTGKGGLGVVTYSPHFVF